MNGYKRGYKIIKAKNTICLPTDKSKTKDLRYYIAQYLDIISSIIFDLYSNGTYACWMLLIQLNQNCLPQYGNRLRHKTVRLAVFET